MSVSLIGRALLFPLIVVCPLFSVGSFLFFLSLIIIIILIGISWALINVNNLTIVSNLAPEDLKGQAFGVYNAIIGIGGVLGALLGGYFAHLLGYMAAFIAASIFVLVGLRIAFKALSTS